MARCDFGDACYLVIGGLNLLPPLQVVVWDTNRDEPLVAQSKIDDYFHRYCGGCCWGGLPAVTRLVLFAVRPSPKCRGSTTCLKRSTWCVAAPCEYDRVLFALGVHVVTQIASSSGDGKILFWSLRNNLEYPLQGCGPNLWLSCTTTEQHVTIF